MQNRLNALPEITKNLLIVNSLMFLASMTFPMMEQHLSLYSIAGVRFQPFQIVTHMFMHGSVMHLLFNMYALYIFGSEIERVFGAKRFLFYYLSTGLGAAFLQSGVNYMEYLQAIEGVPPELLQKVLNWTGSINLPVGFEDQARHIAALANGGMLGASGAVFGLLAAFGMLYPNRIIQLLFPPVALPAKYFVMLYGVMELYLGLSQANTGIAHFAHLGGAIFGVIIILLWRKQGERF